MQSCKAERVIHRARKRLSIGELKDVRVLFYIIQGEAGESIVEYSSCLHSLVDDR